MLAADLVGGFLQDTVAEATQTESPYQGYTMWGQLGFIKIQIHNLP